MQQAVYTFIQDLHRAGVTHAAADEPFDYLSSVVAQAAVTAARPAASAPLKPQRQSAAASTVVLPQTQRQKPQQATDKTTDANAFHYHGAAQPRCVLIYAGVRDGFTSAEQQLLTRMFSAIEMPYDDLGFYRFAEEKAPSEHITREMISQVDVPIVVVGQTACDVLFGKTVATLNGEQGALRAMVHPKLCLQQPQMKAHVWQMLLALKGDINA